MNFKHMPELSHPWSYPLALVAMFACAGAMIVFFFRRGWFGPVSLRVGAATEWVAMGIHKPDEEGDGLRTVMASDSSSADRLHAVDRTTNSEAA
jgi:hypothetical protein